MPHIIKLEWRNFLLARELGKNLSKESLPLDSKFEFPVLKYAMEWLEAELDDAKAPAGETADDAAKRSELLVLVQLARKKLKNFGVEYRDLVFLERDTGLSAHGKVSDALKLPRRFYVLVEDAAASKSIIGDSDDAILDEQFGERLAILFDGLSSRIALAEKRGSGFWTYRLCIALRDRSQMANSPTRSSLGYWVALHMEQGEGDSRSRHILLPCVGPEEYRWSVLAVPSGSSELRKELPGMGSLVTSSVVDPRTLVTVAREERVKFAGELSTPPVVPLELHLWQQDAWSELSRAASALCRFGIDGSTASTSMWDEALRLDPPIGAEIGTGDDSWAKRREDFDRRLKALAGRIRTGDWQVGIDTLSAAVWARRLHRMSYSGLVYQLPDGKVEMLPAWGSDGPIPFAVNAELDTSPANPLLDNPNTDSERLTLCAYYIAMRLGAAAMSSARSLELASDAAAILGVAGTLTPPELVYIRATKVLHDRLKVSVESSLAFGEWLEARQAPNSTAGRAMTSQDVVTLSRSFAKEFNPDEGVEKFSAVASSELPPVQQNTLVSAELHESIVAAMVVAFRDHRSGGMPALLRMIARSTFGSRNAMHAPASVGGHSSLDALSADPAPGLVRLLGRKYGHLSRVIAARATKTTPLRGSRDIVRLGRAGFVGLFKADLKKPESGLSEQILRDIYSRAWSKVNARAQFIAIANESASTSPGSGAAESEPAGKTGMPDLGFLFKQTDLPTCRWGDSVHGPAAYLADTLEFLRHRRLDSVGADDANEDRYALDLLLDRRPDLAEIDLTAANAEVEMPFIDLVCEVLERKVGGKAAYTLSCRIDWNPEGEEVELRGLHSSAVEAIQSSLADWGLQLRIPLSLTPVPAANSAHDCGVEAWILRDMNGLALCLARAINNRDPESWGVRILPQTTLSSDALAAEPQYVAQQAYEKLDSSECSKGYALPWSFGECLLQEHLGIVGLSALDLLSADEPDELACNTSKRFARAIAALGMTQSQGRQVFRNKHDWLAWRSQQELTKGVSLATFLERSGLGFADVQALEQTRSFGAKGFTLARDPTDPCSANADEIKVMWSRTSDQPDVLAHEIGKFLRLRKLLGWSVAQLDRALTSPRLGNSNFDDRFAQRLAAFESVRKQLNQSINDALDVWTRLRTTPLGAAPWSDWRAVFLDTRATGADAGADAMAIGVLTELSEGSGSKKLQDIAAFDSDRERAVATLLTAVLRIPSGSLSSMVAFRYGASTQLSDCTREHLSGLHGAALLMRALDLPLPEFVALVRLVGVESVFDSPQEAVHLCKLKQELTEAGITARGLYDVLSCGKTALSIDVTPPPFRTPEQVMSCAQAIHAALVSVDTPNSDLLLRDWPIASAEGLQSWKDFLASEGESQVEEVTAQLIAALVEPIRRLLPAFDADRVQLRRDQIPLFALPSDPSMPHPPCPDARLLLADALPSPERFDREAASLQRELPVESRLSLSDLLAHSSVHGWIKSSILPALQWTGIQPAELVERLTPWTSVDPTAATKAKEEDLFSRLTYMLVRPLRRREHTRTREQVCADALAQFLGASAAEAWSLAKALPANFEEAARPDSLRVSTWLSTMSTHDPEGDWKAPLAVALERAKTTGQLRDTFVRLAALSKGWGVLSGLGIQAESIDWFEGYSSIDDKKRRAEKLGALSIIDVIAIGPTGPGPGDVAENVRRWRRLAAWAQVFKLTPDVESVDGTGIRLSIRKSVLAATTDVPATAAARDASFDAIARLIGVEAQSVKALLPHDDDSFAKWLSCPATYPWLSSTISFLSLTGLNATEMRDVANRFGAVSKEASRIGVAATVRKSLRKRFTDESWRKAITNGQDRVRTQKRDALVAERLGAGKGYSSTDDIYENLLLDTQMEVGMTTSRIVQAHAAVQQFAQRCLMGLESGWRIPVDELVDWKQWAWMRNFRVWEACRKIFLYPENWMDPEVRDDKSQFFEELEADLNQGELTNENAESAFNRYLHKLHEVARLDVVATYYEFDANVPIMHILGRTPSEPRRYFYRQWQDERQWTPWELVDLEIDGNQILIFKRAGRLYIGWMNAIREEERKPLPTTFRATEAGSGGTRTISVDNTASEPLVRWTLQLSTSERAKEGWQAKRVSPRTIRWPRRALGMSELEKSYVTNALQLVYQDFGAPEILVMRIGGNEGSDAPFYREQVGSFVLSSCLGLGVPEEVADTGSPRVAIYPLVESADFEGYRYLEHASNSDEKLELKEGETAVVRVDLVKDSPGLFSATLAQQATALDLALAVARTALVPAADLLPMTMGIGLPIFYADESIDIVIRAKYAVKAAGDATPREARETTSAKFGRVFGQLESAIGAIEVQDAIAKLIARLENSGKDADVEPLAREILSAIERSAPQATPDRLLEILQTVAAPTEMKAVGAGQTFELAARNHHPLACEMVRRAEERGTPHVFATGFQLTKNETIYRGRARTGLQDAAFAKFGDYALSFDAERDAYACYNWEAFYHVPFTVAMRFVAEAKFEDAIRWFNYIFDPTGVPDEIIKTSNGASVRAFWKTQPFHEHVDSKYGAQRIDILLNPAKWHEAQAELRTLAAGILEWRRRPNLPFQVARTRWVAFQKAVVYRFIETLIAWGDARFRTDTREEITAATQLYALAGRLLGRRPRTDISFCDRQVGGSECGAQSYEQLQKLIDLRDDELSEQLDQLMGDVEEIFDCSENEAPDSPHLNFYNEYFCIPPNEKLLELWDRVADRLFKIRNSQNIDGVTRSLALFAPPIDPALLARAGAAGLSFDQIIGGLNQPRAHYRFATVIQKASEVASELRTLGNELLQCLEKRDAEELALLRSRLELQAIKLNTDIRDQQINDAETQIQVIDQQLKTVTDRQKWFADRVSKKAAPKELEAIEATRGALVVRTRVAAMKSSAAVASMIPRFTVGANGAFGSPHFAMQFSGELYASAQNFFADKLAVESDKDQTGAGITATLAAYERRDEDWALQRDLATGELEQLEKQRLAAEIRRQIAVMEKRNLQRGIESAAATDAFLKSKFTNAKLYDWMVRQVSAIYFKTYQISLDLARAAEDCLNRELPIKQSGVRVIQPGYWDGLRKGLMASTGLIHDLKRLEVEFINRNKRTSELTKYVSLAIVDPLQLMELRSSGQCKFRIPEALFDLDHPGQYARRIKSVSMSIPCITGPYAGVACELSLRSNEIRTTAKRDKEGSNVLKNPVPSEAIYTSSGNNDGGLFELNLKDERYLPFEGAGAANSEWQILLPGSRNKTEGLRQFDYMTISDVVLQIRYTAESVSALTADEVSEKLVAQLDSVKTSASESGLWVYASLRSDLADQFNALLAAVDGRRQVTLKLPKQFARWMGLELKPAGGLALRVAGTGTSAKLASIGAAKEERLIGSKGYWTVAFDKLAIDWMSPAGFELALQGFDTVEDVILLFRGVVAK